MRHPPASAHGVSKTVDGSSVDVERFRPKTGVRPLARFLERGEAEVPMPLGFHVMFRAEDDRVLAPAPGLRRRLARALCAVARPFPLLAFGVADTHLHIVVLADRATSAELARRLPCAVRASLALDAPFAPVRYKALADQQHCWNAFHYVLGQREHHGLGPDPFLDGTSLPDLLGLRVLEGNTLARVREHLPRLKRADLLAHIGRAALDPAPDTDLALLPGADLLDAAAASAGLPDLCGLDDVSVHARAALVQALTPSLGTRTIAELLGRDGSRVRRLRALPVPGPLARAVRLQAALRLNPPA